MGRCPVEPHKLDLIGSTPISAPKGLCLVDLYTNYLTVVLHTDYSSTTTYSTSCYGRRFPSNGWNLPDELTEVCGIAAKDHYKINDGEEKSASLR